MNAITSFLLAAIIFVSAVAEAAPQTKTRQQSGAARPASPQAKKKVTKRAPKKAPAKRAVKSTRPRITPADASGLRDMRPGTLKAMSFAVLEKNSVAEKQKLESFAKRHAKEHNGALARLVLGYHAYQKKNYPEAKANFQAARVIPSAVRDYADYYLAMSNLANGERDAAMQVLSGFAARHRRSSLIVPATLRLAESLVATDRAADAIPLLTRPPVPLSQPVTDLLLAQAYRKNRQPDKAVVLLQKIYYYSPASPQAASAADHLKELRVEMGAAYPNPTAEMRRERSDRLYAAGRWKDAEIEYRSAATYASGTALDRARVRVGVCQFRSGSSRVALTTLRNLKVSDAEADAERIYNLAAVYRRLEQPEAMEQQVELLGRAHPESLWYQRALFMVGNHYLVSQDPARAAQYYTMVYQKFPQGELAAESHWRVAFRRYRERNLAEAGRLFIEQIRDYGTSPQVSSAIYWAGRTLEPDSPADAAVYYKKLVETFPNYYYGLVASGRLAVLDVPPTIKQVATAAPNQATLLLNSIKRPVPDSALDHDGLPPAIQNRRVKARLLESVWLIDLAIEELKAGVGKDYSANFFLGRELAHLEQARGRYNVALNYAKRLLLGYFAFDFTELPREDWELLFPLPWWSHIRERAEALDLDPYLVAGLIRQESEFNPEARSRSNAFGLMQLLPSTARRMAKQMPTGRARAYRLASLTVPEYNVAYGTFYLRQLLNQFNGSLEQTLAGYNAGENRVVRWLQDGNFEEPAEFVESIPFTETREYVQAVLRNAALYRKLYAADHRLPKSATSTNAKLSAESAVERTAVKD